MAFTPTALLTSSPTVTGAVVMPERSVLEQQFAYEYLSHEFPEEAGMSGISNPLFKSGAAGRIHPSLYGKDGGPVKILRGFIRRAEYEARDVSSKARLLFMYNPEQITRDYVSYLDQGALDPFNTVYQSNNLVAPPSFMDFTFALFFDRGDEAAESVADLGVLIDQRYFDLVVRNVVPSSSNNTLPDNGVMMVNPRDITVVFSPKLTVQGRPLNARISFEKFTHRMIPTRMTIQLTMRVVYFGPMKDMVEYTPEETQAVAAIPWNETVVEKVTLRYADIDRSSGVTYGGTDTAGVVGLPGTLDAQYDLTGYSASIAAQAVDYAVKQWTTYGTKYSVPLRDKLWTYADCSSLVAGAYKGIGYSDELRWNNVLLGCEDQFDRFEKSGWRSGYPMWGGIGWPLKAREVLQGKKLKKGDLLYRIKPGKDSDGDSGDHVSFFTKFVGDNQLEYFHAASTALGIRYRTLTFETLINEGYNYCIRPKVFGMDMVGNTSNVPGNVR